MLRFEFDDVPYEISPELSQLLSQRLGNSSFTKQFKQAISKASEMEVDSSVSEPSSGNGSSTPVSSKEAEASEKMSVDSPASDTSSYRSTKKRTGSKRKVGSIEEQEEINSQYQYEDNDIHAILVSRIQKLTSENPGCFAKPVKVLACVDNIIGNQLEQRLHEEQQSMEQHVNKERFVLIPYNLGNFHWVGILFEFQANGQMIRAEYLDSLEKGVGNIPKWLSEQIQRIYPNGSHRILLEKRDGKIVGIKYNGPFSLTKLHRLLKQDDATSCGPCTIENLLLAAHNLVMLALSTEEIRRLHLDCLKTYNRRFYDAFYIRQRDDKPTVASLQVQLGYLGRGVQFTKQEINIILKIKECINKFSNKRIKEVIFEAFKTKKEYENDVQAHLDAIRTALKYIETKIAKAAEKEKENFRQLIALFFGEATPWESAKCKVQYKEIVAVATKEISTVDIGKLQREVEEQIKKDELFATQLQEQAWSVGWRRRDSDGGSPKSPLLFRRLSGGSDSGDSGIQMATAATARLILLSYTIQHGKISIIVNSTQRADTALSGSQGDHITAYTTLLQTVCSVIDEEDMQEAPKMLYEAAKCFMTDPDKIKDFEKLFSDRQEQVEANFFPRETRKKLTHSLRTIQKHSHSKDIKSIKEEAIQQAIQFLLNKNKDTPLDVDHLKDSIKYSNLALFAQFLVEVGNELIKNYNKDDTAVLPKLSSGDKDTSEGNRVKLAMRDLKILNKLLRLKANIASASSSKKEELIQEFQEDCRNIMRSAHPRTNREDTFKKNFSAILGELFKRLHHFDWDNIRKHLDEINQDNLKAKAVGKLFNDLFDFKASHVRRRDITKDPDEDEAPDGSQINGEIIFSDPADVLYKVTERHVKFMFIAFKDLNLLAENVRTGIIQGYLEHVVQKPSVLQGNGQGWGNYQQTETGVKQPLNAVFIYGKMERALDVFFENDVLMPSLKKARR